MSLVADMPFLRRFLAHPFQVASPIPSGPALARAIAQQIQPIGSDPVLELGPGTGTVTQAIRDRGVAASRIVAIESDGTFVRLLRDRFPRSRILQGDAFDFVRTLEAENIVGPFRAIVSGIPVLTQPMPVRERLVKHAMCMLKPQAPFIQFSYGRKPPLPAVSGTVVRRAQIVWRNVPPMHIWVYRAMPEN